MPPLPPPPPSSPPTTHTAHNYIYIYYYDVILIYIYISIIFFFWNHLQRPRWSDADGEPAEGPDAMTPVAEALPELPYGCNWVSERLSHRHFASAHASPVPSIIFYITRIAQLLHSNWMTSLMTSSWCFCSFRQRTGSQVHGNTR